MGFSPIGQAVARLRVGVAADAKQFVHQQEVRAHSAALPCGGRGREFRNQDGGRLPDEQVGSLHFRKGVWLEKNPNDEDRKTSLFFLFISTRA
jgi:hypothetical protein